jgi:hypothetical protein
MNIIDHKEHNIIPAVLTIATKDYAEQWRFCIQSQSNYCKREGYEYHVIDPKGEILHPKWMKLQTALKLLETGCNVFLIDADAEITSRCPPFMSIFEEYPSSDILFVNGISGRPNSGVLFFRGGNSSIAKQFLQECLSRKKDTIPSEDFVTPEGENGHVIHLLKLPAYKERSHNLSILWNCSIPDYADEAYVRHYTNLLREKLIV